MLLLVTWFLMGNFSGASEKLSLQEQIKPLKKTEQIASLYKKSSDLALDPSSELKDLWQSNEPLMRRLEQQFQRSQGYIRGEVEDEKVLQQLMLCLQLSLLKARSAAFQGQWPELQNQLSSWFLFAADFPYEESSLVGLRTSGVIRSLLLDDWEKIQTKFAAEIAHQTGLRSWFAQVRAPWPVDRVLVTEAKRLLKPPMISVAQATAQAFQKNPYQTSEQALTKIRGGQSQQAQLLKQIWRQTDIDLMRTEINRIGKLKLRLAVAEYQDKNKKPPRSVQDLIKAQLLEQAPIDYRTGQPLDLTSL